LFIRVFGCREERLLRCRKRVEKEQNEAGRSKCYEDEKKVIYREKIVMLRKKAFVESETIDLWER